MADLEQLTNNQLRDELKKNGLGNFPVTDTTRKLLIKKLRNTLEGKTAPAAKPRRETVHVPKIIDDSESEKETSVKTKTVTNRRATIAAQPAAKEVKSKPGRTTPLQPPNSSILSRNTIDITDNSDDDAVVQGSQSAKNRRTSRSPSLGKSTVVTTSYKHTIEPLNELDADGDIEEDEFILPNDKSSGNSNNANGFSSSERANQYSSPFSWSKPSVERRTTYDVNTNYASPALKDGNIFYDKSREGTTTEIYKRRFTTNTIGKTNEREDDNDDDDDNLLTKHETPFLSNFTRRLAELKAEPLPSISRTVDREQLPASSYRTTPSTYYRDYTTSHLNRGYHPTKNDTVWESFKNFLKAFETKVRWPFLILVVLLALIFVYVFLFTN